MGSGKLLKIKTSSIAITWCLFQIGLFSPFISLDKVNSTYIHFIFATLLCTFISIPSLKSNIQKVILIVSTFLTILSTFYLSVILPIYFPDNEASDIYQIVLGILAVISLLAITYLVLEKPLFYCVTGLLIYSLFVFLISDEIESKEESIGSIISQIWFSTEGIFGSALKISNDYIFIFMLFSVLMVQLGAVHYFGLVSYYIVKDWIGASAKSVTVASGLGGAIYGPALEGHMFIERTTIPYMDDFFRENKKLIEAMSKILAQLVPPILGAGGFLIINYAGVTYSEIILGFLLPSFVLYIVFLFLVHQRALRFHGKGLPRKIKNIFSNLIFSITTVIGFVAVCYILFKISDLLHDFFPDLQLQEVFFYFIIAYIVITAIQSKFPDLEQIRLNIEHEKFPSFISVVISGLHCLLPFLFLIASFEFDEESPGYAAYFSTFFLIIIILTRKVLTVIFHGKKKRLVKDFPEGIKSVTESFINSSKYMSKISLTLAVAGILIGILSITGIGGTLAGYLESASFENLIVCCILSIIVIILVSGSLNPTIVFILGSYIMVPVIISVASLNGYTLNLLTANLFIFFSTVLISAFSPLIDTKINRKGGLGSMRLAAHINYEHFKYCLGFLVLPLYFIFNPSILLIEINQVSDIIILFLHVLSAIIVLLAAINGYLLIRNKRFETAALVLVAFVFLNPGMWIDMFFAPYGMMEGKKILEVAEQNSEGKKIKIIAKGINDIGEERSFTFIFQLGSGDSGEDRLASYGLKIKIDKEQAVIKNVFQGSSAENDGFGPDFVIEKVGGKQPQPNSLIPLIPASLLLLLILWLQITRPKKSFQP